MLLLSILREYVDKKLLTENQKGILSLFNYTREVQFDGLWDTITSACRGLVLDRSTDRIVARPFDKFFNLGEKIASLPDPSGAVVVEKYDGCLGIVFCYNDVWDITTRGSFTSEQAVYARQKLLPKLNLGELDKSKTYLFEIIIKDAVQGALKYDFDGLVLLAVRDTLTGKYWDMNKTLAVARVINAVPPKVHNVIADDSFVKQLAASTESREGVVITYPNGLRLKIKTDQYVSLHRLCAQYQRGYKNIIKAVADESLLKEVPEEYLKVVLEKAKPFLEYKRTTETTLRSFVDANKHLTRKDFAAAVKQQIAKPLQGACFQLLDTGKILTRHWLVILKHYATEKNLE